MVIARFQLKMMQSTAKFLLFLQFFVTFGNLNFYILFSPLFERYVWRRFKRSGLKTKEGREDRKLIRFGNGAQRLQLSVSDVDLVN